MAVHFALDARPLVVAERHDARETVERRRHVVGLLGDQQRAPVELVAGDHGAEAVQHAPARRRDQPRADPVLVGQRGVAGALDHLHLVEPAASPPSSADLAAHQQQGAAGEDAGAAGITLMVSHDWHVG